MRGFRTAVCLALAALLLGGCAAKVKRGEGDNAPIKVSSAAARKVVLTVVGKDDLASDNDWKQVVDVWRDAMSGAAAARGLGYVYVKPGEASANEPATLIQVQVNAYRLRSTGARLAFGIMTGNAHMDATVSYFELPARQPAGTRRYNTSSSAWEGAFSAMSAKQVEAISEEILKELP